MNEKDKTKEQLIDEVAKLSQRIAQLEKIKEEFQQRSKSLLIIAGLAIRTVARTVEARDPFTDGHQQRAANLARAIANEMGLLRDQIEGIRMAGSIHDIGKILIPKEILTNQDRLTDLEFDEIKKHPEAGYEILKTIEFPWPVGQIVLQHHERVDGSGYPLGLSRENILLEARILGVADVVEAMTSPRIYRAAHSINEALDEISQNKGILYDREAVDACLRLFIEKEFKWE
jgi:putative nucleotidyltransferase with HDIG domain